MNKILEINWNIKYDVWYVTFILKKLNYFSMLFWYIDIHSCMCIKVALIDLFCNNVCLF